MKKLRKLGSGLCLAAVLAFSILPATVVHADDGTGPQGTSNSTTTKAPPPPSSYDLWAILLWLIMLFFGQ
jgi:hypothetical protein